MSNGEQNEKTPLSLALCLRVRSLLTELNNLKP